MYSSSKLHVDSVLAISILDREDRRTQLVKSLSGTGLDVEFMLVERDPTDPQRGCFNSHKKCAQLILARGYEFALILEDDTTIREWRLKHVHRLNSFLRKKKPDLLFLGLILGKVWLTWHAGIARSRGSGSHAYIMSRNCAQRVSELEYDGRGIDTVYRKEFKQYCAFPMLAEQASSSEVESDIQRFRASLSSAASDPAPNVGRLEFSWEKNRKKQYFEAIRSLWKPLFFYDQ
jgi:glycosyl transferase, family 25